ncbi:MAG: hypothetical protein AAF170_08000 [Bacteroidota bacterium]
MNDFGSFGPDEALALARLTPIVDAMLDAHQRGDYTLFSQHATPAFRAEVTEARFARAHREVAPTLGALQSMQFLGARLDDGHPLLRYAVQYADVDGDTRVQVRFTNGTEPPAVDWMWIE